MGKAAIAAVMLSRERESTLFPPQATKQHWYRLLLNILDSDPGSFKQNRLAVVTFNYDRSLEHYLFKTLSSPTRGRSESQAIDDLCSIEIVHVHGSLGPLPYEAEGEGLPYGADLSGDLIRTAAEGIIIVGDAEDDTPEFMRARELLREARRIVFLGLGFHPESIRRLGVFNEPWTDEDRARTEVGATMSGIIARDQEVIKGEILNGALTMGHSHTVFPFLRENFWLDR